MWVLLGVLVDRLGGYVELSAEETRAYDGDEGAAVSFTSVTAHRDVGAARSVAPPVYAVRRVI
jgi:hypothetical protein